ncbi:DsbA family protein [Chelativorans sp. YIM 93263]|uniref:DsbA family protein n=1 Tax=Chelativorans sp. YIM 93263 TaxID=2906648 RepID=UPI0023797759|nr:DsbA family protein [Chelativorans sp. YIM 93263]
MIELTRRRILTSLVVLMALPVLASCSDNGQANADDAPSNATTAAVDAPASSGTADVDELMASGALPDKALGDEDAPVTIIEYASMTCGHCANFHNNTFPALEEEYIDTGKVRFIMREFPFDPRAEAGFMLARCADDKYFPMVDVLFEQQSRWARAENASAELLRIARLAGFTQESFEACLTDQQLLDDVRSVRARAAENFGVEATPTFFINGKKYSGAMSIAQMSAIIDPLL